MLTRFGFKQPQNCPGGCNQVRIIEIQKPRRKNMLIDYERLQRLLGAGSYDQRRSSHNGWIEEYLGSGAKTRQEEWTGSIAVGSRSFVENVKARLRFRAKGREVIEVGERYQLREGPARYKALFGVEKDQIGPENSYPWNVKP
jgi:hypothetical protein